jgi:hypothetical protein
MIKFKNREISLTVYGEQDDVQVWEAYYLDSGEHLTDAEIESLPQELLAEAWLDKQIERADFYDFD